MSPSVAIAAVGVLGGGATLLLRRR